MTATKPSPAPWAYEYNPYTVRLTGDRDSNAAGTELPAYEVFDAEGNKVFDTDEDMPGEIQEANACLGAAAPVLLEALEYVRATLKLRHLDEATDDEVEEALKIAQTALDQAKAAGAMPEPHGIISRERTLDRTTSDDLNAPWSLRFDRDGTEDVAVILDASGDELLRSRHFWLPERDDPIPATLAAMRLIHAAPAFRELAKQIVLAKDTEESVPVDIYNAAARLIARAESGWPERESPETDEAVEA